MQRRNFLRLGMSATGAGLLRYAAAQTKAPAGIKLATMFTDRPNEDDLTTLRHAGVEAVSIWTTIENNSAEWMIAMRNKLEANGIEVYNIGILDLHCDPALVLSLPEAAAKIEQYKTYRGNLGRAGIHYTTYAHMSNIKNQPTDQLFGSYAAGGVWARGMYQMGGWTTGINLPDPDLSSHYLSKEIASDANPTGAQSYRYSNPQLDTLFKPACPTRTFTLRNQVVKLLDIDAIGKFRV